MPTPLPWGQKQKAPPAPAAAAAPPAANAWARGQKVVVKQPTPAAAPSSNAGPPSSVPADYMMNQATKEYVAQLYHAFNNGLVADMKRLYTYGWKEQSKMYYRDSPWPSEDAIAALNQRKGFVSTATRAKRAASAGIG